MSRLKAAALAVMLMLVPAGCAHQGGAQASPAGGYAKVNSVYIWDADGHTDWSLLVELKSQAASYLQSKGISVSPNPYSTEAYVKITVIDAGGAGSKTSFLRARLYILDAGGGGVIYDNTYEAREKAGGDTASRYPVSRFVRGALEDYLENIR